MKTTSLLAELLVIGFWSSFWLIALLCNFADFELIFKIIKTNFLLILVVLAIVYFLGMLINLIADASLSFVDKFTANKFGGKLSLVKTRTKIILKSSEAANYLFQRRSFVRIYRANCINTLILFHIAIFDVGNFSNRLGLKVSILSMLLFLLFILSFLGYYKTLNGYFNYIKLTGEYIDEK